MKMNKEEKKNLKNYYI